MTNNYSLKKSLIINLSDSTLVEGLEQNKLVLVTAFGNIVGKPLNDKDLEHTDDNKNFLPIMVELFSKEYLKDKTADGNDGYIILKDVKITSPSNTTTNLPFLVVFYDQIIGVTIGNISID